MLALSTAKQWPGELVFALNFYMFSDITQIQNNSFSFIQH